MCVDRKRETRMIIVDKPRWKLEKNQWRAWKRRHPKLAAIVVARSSGCPPILFSILVGYVGEALARLDVSGVDGSLNSKEGD
jgi:fibrillarin-like rRNA methylase